MHGEEGKCKRLLKSYLIKEISKIVVDWLDWSVDDAHNKYQYNSKFSSIFPPQRLNYSLIFEIEKELDTLNS